MCGIDCTSEESLTMSTGKVTLKQLALRFGAECDGRGERADVLLLGRDVEEKGQILAQNSITKLRKSPDVDRTRQT
jgi:hypothetical protein